VQHSLDFANDFPIAFVAVSEPGVLLHFFPFARVALSVSQQSPVFPGRLNLEEYLVAKGIK
jgi:hypothetical protein